jgi:uncharacterized BrkB/YihY/UPF0761 family membrane protein
MLNGPESSERSAIEVEAAAKPALAGLRAGPARLKSRVEDARRGHASVDICLDVVDGDSRIAGGVLAGALAFRLFEYLLPLTLFLVSGLGLYADAAGRTPEDIVGDGGLTGLIAHEVAATASGGSRLLVLALTLPLLVYYLVGLYRAIASVHALAWYGSARGVRASRRGLIVFAFALVVQLLSLGIVGEVRDQSDLGGVVALVAYVVVIAATWTLVATTLPHNAAGWRALVPGAALLGAGMLVIHAVNAYIVTWLIESRVESYGALGVAAALLFSLYLVGRLIIASAVFNATLARRHRPSPVAAR